MSAEGIAVVVVIWLVHIALVVRAWRRGRWGWALAGLVVFPPAAWIGALLKPRDEGAQW